jgi:hypothetical protein
MRNILYPSGKAVYVSKKEALETPVVQDDHINAERLQVYKI